MKKIISAALLAGAFFSLTACNHQPASHPAPPVVSVQQTPSMEQPAYQLFPTKNMWMFLKLNTVNGKIWMVQYSLDKDESRFEALLNPDNLLAAGQPEVKGRFTLVPTTNMWNFILLDQICGSQWQVQWSHNGENNFVIPITGNYAVPDDVEV